MKKKNLNKVSLPNQISVQDHEPVKARCRVLIVSEGTKTEPNYFKSFDMIQHGGLVINVDCKGEGQNTIQVVRTAIHLKNMAIKNGNPYDAVWAVFDKDNFPADKFNTAISIAEQNGIAVAWSNEAFELWYILHFEYRNTPMARQNYQKEITRQIRVAANDKKYTYQKNAQDTHLLLEKYGNEALAIRNAERLMGTYFDQCYADHNPCTTVYRLVRLLRGEDEKFMESVMNNIFN